MPNYKNCLIIDTETNGDKDNPICIEIGWVLYSIEHQTMLDCGSFLCNLGEKNKATLINKIPSPVPVDSNSTGVVQDLFNYITQDPNHFNDDIYIVAHNKTFDKKIVELHFDELWDDEEYENYKEKKWLCTYEDFALFPDEYQGKRDLISLAQFYGVGISSSHRAIYDCLLISEVFNRVLDLQKAFAIAVERSKKSLIIALASYEEKKIVKEHGFHWNEANGYFTKVIPTVELNHLDYPFKIINNSLDDNQNIDKLIEIMIETQTYLISANVSYDERESAKEHGFKWENKQWVKRVSNTAPIPDYPFKITVLG
jgi:DNA polymerase-3 subunit epsilon